MLTPKMSGIFDCRKYDSTGKKQHDQREMMADTDNVTFSALFANDAVPECFKIQGTGEFDPLLRPKVTRREREAAEREGREAVADAMAAKFKIGANCKWFDKFGKPCDRPTNAELEANRWNVQIDFTRKDKDVTNPLKPSGYWVNAIMVAKVENNPFAGQAFENAPEDDDPQDVPSAGDHDDLPFD